MFVEKIDNLLLEKNGLHNLLNISNRKSCKVYFATNYPSVSNLFNSMKNFSNRFNAVSSKLLL